MEINNSIKTGNLYSNEFIKNIANYLEHTRNDPYTEDDIIKIIENKDKYWEFKAKQLILMFDEYLIWNKK